MKKSFIAILLALIILLCGCVASTEPATDIPKKDEETPPVTDAPATHDELLGGDSTPSDVPATPSDTDGNGDPTIDILASPDDIPETTDTPTAPDDIASMSKPYKIDNNITAAKINGNKQRLSSMGGLPGFSVYITYDADTDSYSIVETMGDYEAIDHMYIWNTGLTVVFRDYVTFHKWMTEIPSYLSVNSSSITLVSPEGYEFESTTYDYTFSGNGILTEESGQLTLNFSIDQPMIVEDFYLCCGKID